MKKLHKNCPRCNKSLFYVNTFSETVKNVWCEDEVNCKFEALYFENSNEFIENICSNKEKKYEFWRKKEKRRFKTDLKQDCSRI